MPSPAAKTYICATCRSDQIKLDAWAAWSIETQSWELAATMELAFCENCDGETTLVEQPVSTPALPDGPFDYEIIVNGSTIYHRSPDPAAALEEHEMASQDHRDDNPPALITIQRRSGDTVEQMTFPELLDAAHHVLRTH